MAANECLTADCHGPNYCRGLCKSCYAAALYLVQSEQTTFDELEALKLVEKAERKRRRRSPFMRAFEKALLRKKT